MRITPICLATLLSLPVLLRAQTPAPSPSPASITIDAASSPGPVNRLVFGTNINSADTARIFSSDKTDLDCIGTAGGFWDPARRAPVQAVIDRFREGGVTLLRYPGGSLVANYDWRKAVGTLEARGNWKFGIAEYLIVCEAIGAVPMFTVSDYVLPADQMPAHAAGLVEYLNSPATPDHPWAMKRKEWGHPDPYGVKWFELGNESDEGNLHVIPHRHYTPEQYAAYANATSAAMRAVDPSIKIGIVTMPGAGTDVQCNWNRTVIRLAGKSADFLIVHVYGPDVSKYVAEPDFFQACMAAGDQTAQHIDDYEALALEQCGRSLPICMTEYNGAPSPDKGPDRLSYGVALECADLLRVYLQPEHHVLAAAYWQSLNGLFEMLLSDRHTPEGLPITEMPEFHLFHLFTAHLGTRLAAVSVNGPRLSFAGAGSVYPAAGDLYVPSHSLGQVPTDGRFNLANLGPGITGTGGTGGAFSLRLDGVGDSGYPPLAVLPKPKGAGPCNYVVSFEARFVPDPGSQAPHIGLNVGDVRGWVLTRSAVGFNGIGAEWTAFREPYHGLPDTTAIMLQANLAFGSAKVSGLLEVRGLKVEAFSAPIFPAYSLLTALASLSEDGKTLHLIVFNKSAGLNIPATLHLAGFHAASARVWEVNGPFLGALGGVTETVQGAPLEMAGAEPVHVFPAHSLTAIDFAAQAP